MRTPWGRADQLRERMLRPGPGMSREEVARSQRERLLAASVACVASRGYEATAVADLLELSGVSRSAFYEHFRDKEECVLAAFDAIVVLSLEALCSVLAEEGSRDEKVGRALDVSLQAIVRQQAAARLCFCDVYAVGEPGRLAAERAMAKATEIAAGALNGIRDGEKELPRSIVHGLVGGMHLVSQRHLRREEVAALPAYAEDIRTLVCGYEPPGKPLRLRGRRARPTGGPPPFVAYNQAERIIRALAAAASDRGYPAVTVAEIAARASISQATFYSHFADKNEALIAAIDSAGSQLLGVAMPAARRAGDWPNALRAAVGGLCAFYASEPDLARLAVVEIYAAGSVALERRDKRFEEFLALLEQGFEMESGARPITVDVTLGAAWTLVYQQIVNGGAEGFRR